ncbi:MAG: hypothetical protein ACFFD4_28960, partial [Candidatus Odinarchaeota archaeon]
MLRLREITRISRRMLCYCGNPLIGDFCPDHGFDIRIDSFFVDASFDMPVLSDPHPISISLPETQFLRLFRRKKGIQISEEISRFRSCYEMVISNPVIAVDELMKNFFDEMDILPFFGDYYRIKSHQIRKSGVIIHFLCTSRIISDNTIRFYFSILPLRRISDYIAWRLKQTRATRADITHSLKTVRARVYTGNGKAYRINDVLWQQDETFPIIEISNSQDTVKVHPSRLLQDHSNFFLGQKTEMDSLSGLDSVA